MKPYYYKGVGRTKSICGLDVIKTGPDKLTIVLSELPGNPGTPVSDFFEELATILYDTQIIYLKIGPEEITWIEHVPEGAGGGEDIAEERYDQVILEWDGRRFGSPRWVTIPRDRWREYRLKG